MAVSRRRPLLWLGVLVGIALLTGGLVVAYDGYIATNTPGAVVGRYLAALTRADAPAALALGDVPAGSRALLTSDALKVQQHNAAIGHVVVGPVQRTGSTARVHVTYLLSWPSGARAVSADVGVHQDSGRWRLDRVAVATELDVRQAAQRVTAAGTAVPHSTVLLFPGAAPLSFDTPYLQLGSATSAISFAPAGTTAVQVEVTDAGRRAASSLVSSALMRCLSSRATDDCPQPAGRYVPGSLRGGIAQDVPALAVTVADGAAGVLEVSGNVPVLGTYRRLTFANRPVAGKGRVSVYVHASAYAVAPLRFAWTNT